MFEHYSPGQLPAQKKMKGIALMQNGKPAKLIKYEFSKSLAKEELIRIAEKNWGGSFRTLRVFSIDAVEYFEEDLLYVKNGERLYLSRGEDFDFNSNFGEYQIVKKLGEGGFGSVELARNLITGEFAAIKILKTKNSTSSDIDMIFREAANLKSLNHPNIVKILNCYAMNDMRVVIVMEYLEGGELLELLKQKGRFDENLARNYFRQIILAVHYCHGQGIIHRDLKLENILLKDEKTIKVADFGISGVADRFNPEADWGTLRYMAPEVLSGKNKQNYAGVDVWACGIILFFMVTGSLPFNGSTTAEIMSNIANKNVQFPQNILLSLRCRNLIKKMLNKDPEARASMNDIESDPWVLNREQRISALKTAASEEVNLRMLDIRKQQRKSVNLPKATNVRVPKRLEKEKDRVVEELREYRIYKRGAGEEKKLFPSLNRKKKYSSNNKMQKMNVNKKSSELEEKRAQAPPKI